MSRKEKINWLINNLNLYPVAVSDIRLFERMTNKELDLCIYVECRHRNGEMTEYDLQRMIDIVVRIRNNNNLINPAVSGYDITW